MMVTPANCRCPRAAAGLLCLLVLATVPGCIRNTRRTISRLEARIRVQESRIAELKQAVEQSEAELVAARREADDLRVTLTSGEKPAILPEQAASWFRIDSIRINPYLSGGLNRDDTPGDEILAVLISPEDASGETLRTAGTIELTAYDFASAEEDRVVGQWTFTEEESRDLWHAGVIGRGLQLRVPLTRWPTASRIFVHARLTTPDGRQFDTNESLSVTPQTTMPNRLPSPLDGDS